MSEEKFWGWVASLSNGETVFEGKEVEGELSPWQKLRAYCEKNNLYITQIRLQLGRITLIGLQKADGYCQCWEQHVDLFNRTRPPRIFRGIGSVVGNIIYMTWIDESGNIRQEIRDYENMSVHCVMRKQ